MAIPEYFQIKRYIIAPNKRSLPLLFEGDWYEDSTTLLKKSVSVREILKEAFGISYSQFDKRLVTVNGAPSKDFILSKGIYEIHTGKKHLTVWFCDYIHTALDYISYYKDKLTMRLSDG